MDIKTADITFATVYEVFLKDEDGHDIKRIGIYANTETAAQKVAEGGGWRGQRDRDALIISGEMCYLLAEPNPINLSESQTIAENEIYQKIMDKLTPEERRILMAKGFGTV